MLQPNEILKTPNSPRIAVSINKRWSKHEVKIFRKIWTRSLIAILFNVNRPRWFTILLIIVGKRCRHIGTDERMRFHQQADLFHQKCSGRGGRELMS